MSIISIARDTNNNVSLVRMQVSDNLATVAIANYIINHQDEINQLNGGVFDWFMTDMLLIAASDGNALFQFTNNTFKSLIIYGEQGTGTVQPGLANQIAYYPANGATIAGLATAANGVLITNNSSVPSISSILPSAVQLNITSLGTIGSGVWNGTPVTVPFGGTGNTTFTAYSVVCAGTTATGTFQNVLDLGIEGQFLTSKGPGNLPIWTSNPASGVINPGSANSIAYYASNGSTISEIVTALSSVFVTSGAGVPSWSSTLPSGLTIPGYQTTLTLPLSLSQGGTNANLTANNGGIVWSNATQLQILAGTTTARQMLQSGSTGTPAWSTTTYPATNSINTLLYASAANVLSELATSNSAVLVTSAGGVPSFSSTLPAFTTSSITFSPSTGGIVGTATNDNAAAGKVGEIISATQTPTVAMTNTTSINVTSISLTAGDWDVNGNVVLENNNTPTQITQAVGWISTTSATLPALEFTNIISTASGGSFLNYSMNVPFKRISITTTTTVYLSAQSNFSGTTNVGGGIFARRVR